jgi:hypothetical protein
MNRSLTVILAALLVVMALPAMGAAGSAATSPPSIARFEGGWIDLSNGWGEATACLVYKGATECFRDRAALLERESELQAQMAESQTILASCSTALRLYQYASYGGRELVFYDRGYWQNLSTWSFDNQLSSYKVGACGVYLADGANGSGSWYPGNTSAGHNEPSMSSGWDNRVSSIYIQ